MNQLKNIKMKISSVGVDYYLINSSDEFLNEYVPESEMKLKLVTNFTGSNGMALISQNKDYFFTDGRYTLQAKKELNKSFQIFDSQRMNLLEYISKNFFKKKKILLDTRTFRYDFVLQLKKILSKTNSLIKHDNKIINISCQQIQKKRS